MVSAPPSTMVKRYALIGEGLKSLRPEYTSSVLAESTDHILSSPGKRVRAILALMGHGLVDQNEEHALPVAVAIELFHNFTLVHDDIMDQAPLRRGRPTVQRKWNDEVAILTGDVILAEAIELLTVQGLPTRELVAELCRTARGVCEGQQMDMEFEARKEVTLSEYLEMIRLKTSVLLGASLKMGVIAANGDDQLQERVYQIGVNIGMAFQLMDDWLDLYGKEEFGKQVGGDVIKGKKTYLYLRALEKGEPADMEEMAKASAASEPESRVAGMLAVFNRLGVGNDCLGLVETYTHMAYEGIGQLDQDNPVTMELKILAKRLLERTH